MVVALVREHAEKVGPPRALWVPFMLGRPFGEPDNPERQTQVLRQALALLEAGSGPVLEDADVPEPVFELTEGWSCPVSFPKATDDSLADRVRKEIAELQPWYDVRVRAADRTSVGLSEVSIDECAESLVRFSLDSAVAAADAQTVANQLRWWSSDLKAFYMEALLAQPGEVAAQDMERWFWQETAAGALFLELRQLCLEHVAPEVREVGLYMIGDLESELSLIHISEPTRPY